MSRPSFLEKLWCDYVVKHAQSLDSVGDPIFLLRGMLYSYSTLMPKRPLVCDGTAPSRNWQLVDADNLVSLCKEHYTEEQIKIAQLQYELTQ